MPEAEFDVYVLVHPEVYPTNDPRVVHRVFRTEDEPVWADMPGAPDDDAIFFEDADDGLYDPSAYGWHAEHGDIRHLLTGFDERIAALTAAHAVTAARRILIDDGAVAESSYDADTQTWHEDLLPGVLGDGWEVFPAQPHELTTKVPGLLPAGTRVLLAGFSRHDCVARVATALQADGCQVTIDEPATLPLGEGALLLWLTRDAAAIGLTQDELSEPAPTFRV